jgi:hypothetical protein
MVRMLRSYGGPQSIGPGESLPRLDDALKFTAQYAPVETEPPNFPAALRWIE